MKLRRSTLITLLGLGLFLLLLGGIKYFQIKKAMSGGAGFLPPPEAVTTTVVKSQDWVSVERFVGSVSPVQGVMVSAEADGRVAQIGFESGAQVKEGDLLVQLDTSVEEASLKAAEARTYLAKVNYSRAQQLWERKANSKSELDAAEAQFKQSLADVEAVKAVIRRKAIRAPFGGTLGIRQVNVGQYVTAGAALVPLHSLDRVYVNFSIPQSRVGTIRVGQSVEVFASTESATPAQRGDITSINPQLNKDTRTIEAQATLDNPHGVLRAGMFVRVEVQGQVRNGVLAVPLSAVNYAPFGDSVYVLKKLKSDAGVEYTGVVRKIVVLGDRRGDVVVVESGLQDGDEVVTSGGFKLRPQAAVLVNNVVTPSQEISPRPPDT